MVGKNQGSNSRWTTKAVQVRSQLTLERILDATERLLKVRPFREITVAEIAQEASASPTSLYARFQNKQALLGALFERHSASQQELIGRLSDPALWKGVPLAKILKQALPAIVESFRAKQPLIRAFLEQASDDYRFRQEWAAVGEFHKSLVLRLIMDRRDEVGHPDPERGVRRSMETVFATLAVRIIMHEIDAPDLKELTDDLTSMLLRHMCIEDRETNVNQSLV